MRTLYGTYSLHQQNLALTWVRGLVVPLWAGIEPVRPGDVYLARDAKRIDATDSALPQDTSSGWSKFVMGFRFNEDDQTGGLDQWYPQGITGSADADESGYVDERKFLIVSWYCRWPGTDRGKAASRVGGSQNHLDDFENPEELLDLACSRISLIDVTDMDEIKYRHILLVEPVLTEGRADFVAAIEQDADGNPRNVAHCGGCVWFGHWLYVASGDELLVFDMDLISDIKGQNSNYADSDTVGYSGGKYHAFGYRYVLPLIARYRFTSESEGWVGGGLLGGGGFPGTAVDFAGSGPFSALGLDRGSTPPRLIAAKYVTEASGFDEDPSHRVVIFWDLNESTGVLDDPDASAAYRTDTYYVQGVHAWGDTVWFSQSGTGVAELGVRTTTGSVGSEYDWPAGAEGLTYSTPSGDRLWCVTEYTNARVCFAVYRDDAPP